MWDGASELAPAHYEMSGARARSCDCGGPVERARMYTPLPRVRRESRHESHNAVVVTRQRGGESHTGKRRDLTVVSFRQCVNVASFLTYVRQNGHTYTHARIARLPMTVD